MVSVGDAWSVVAGYVLLCGAEWSGFFLAGCRGFFTLACHGDVFELWWWCFGDTVALCHAGGAIQHPEEQQC